MRFNKLSCSVLAVSGLQTSIAAATPLRGFTLQNIEIPTVVSSSWSFDSLMSRIFGSDSQLDSHANAKSAANQAVSAGMDKNIIVDTVPNDSNFIKLYAGDGVKVPGNSPFTLCDADVPHLAQIDYIDLAPNPPLKGEALNVTAGGVLKTTIDEGSYVEVDVRYGYIRLLKQKFDLCEQVGNVDLKCPVEEGKLDLAKSVDLPQEIPPGKYLVIARAFTAADELLTCLTATVEFPAIA